MRGKTFWLIRKKETCLLMVCECVFRTAGSPSSLPAMLLTLTQSYNLWLLRCIDDEEHICLQILVVKSSLLGLWVTCVHLSLSFISSWRRCLVWSFSPWNPRVQRVFFFFLNKGLCSTLPPCGLGALTDQAKSLVGNIHESRRRANIHVKELTP